MLRLRLRLVSTAIALLLLGSTSAFAETLLFAILTNDQEFPLVNPSPRPASFGTANFELNDARTRMSFNATIFNIDVTGNQTADPTDNLTNAHIHASATLVPPATAGVVWGFFGAPFNDNAPNDSGFTPFATGVGGNFFGAWDLTEGQGTTLTAQLDNILNNRSYINFHTLQFGGGEIRGAIQQVPEPSALLLLVTGMIGLVRVRQRMSTL